jgi:hypothetical protein
VSREKTPPKGGLDFSHYIGNVRGASDFGQQQKHPDDVWQIPILAPVVGAHHRRVDGARWPSAGMRAEAAEAGFYESPWGKHPRIQLLTIRELLDGRGIDCPHVAGANVTHRRAAKAQAPRPEAPVLFGMEKVTD